MVNQYHYPMGLFLCRQLMEAKLPIILCPATITILKLFYFLSHS